MAAPGQSLSGPINGLLRARASCFMLSLPPSVGTSFLTTVALPRIPAPSQVFSTPARLLGLDRPPVCSDALLRSLPFCTASFPDEDCHCCCPARGCVPEHFRPLLLCEWPLVRPCAVLPRRRQPHPSYDQPALAASCIVCPR